jgi:hypothetical protein
LLRKYLYRKTTSMAKEWRFVAQQGSFISNDYIGKVIGE